MKILTLTGPSCSGKTTLLNELVENHDFKSIVSHTTRPKRPGEIYGKDYYFIPQDVFDLMKSNGKFIESISFNGYSYGVGLEEIEEAHASGKIAVLIVEPNGLIQIMKYAENTDIEVNSVYLGGNIYQLIERYLGRLAGEDLGAEGVAKRHAKRIQSMINERIEWQPLDIQFTKEELEGMPLRFGTIPYRLKLKELGPENFDETIAKINEMEF